MAAPRRGLGLQSGQLRAGQRAWGRLCGWLHATVCVRQRCGGVDGRAAEAGDTKHRLERGGARIQFALLARRACFTAAAKLSLGGELRGERRDEARVSASPLPPSETAAAHASGPSSEAGATSSPALVRPRQRRRAPSLARVPVRRGRGHRGGRRGHGPSAETGRCQSRAPRPSATGLSAPRGRDSRVALLWPASASPPMPGCAAASAAALSTLSTVESTEAEPAIQARLEPTAVGSAALFTSPLGRASFGGGSIALPGRPEPARAIGPFGVPSARIWRAAREAQDKKTLDLYANFR